GNIPLVAIPKTIDRDIGLTDTSIGYHTAVSKVVEAAADLEGTARSHDRIAVIETMGRTRGCIALEAAILAKADAVVIPEVPHDIKDIAAHLRARRLENDGYASVIVAEGVELA